MLWQKTGSLREIPMGYKLGLTAFLLIAGLGYLLGFANIYLTYSPVDQKPGLSIQDISISFYGARGATKLEKAIDGSMKQYLASEADGTKLKDWIKAGGKETDFGPVSAIFSASCNTCHSSEAKVADVVTADYARVSELLAQDTGKSISRLVSLSHTHVLATLPVIFLLCLVFSFTAFPLGLKGAIIVLSFCAIILDIGSWWLAKLAEAFAPLVLLGGVYLALSFLVLIVLSLYDIWLRKASQP